MPYVTTIQELGRAEGRLEGRQEGRLSGLRDSTIGILEARFGDVPFSIREQLALIQDEVVLHRLVRHAALTPDLEVFQAQLRH